MAFSSRIVTEWLQAGLDDALAHDVVEVEVAGARRTIFGPGVRPSGL